MKILSDGKLGNTLLESKYIRLRGHYDKDKLGVLQRSIKYKLQALMELGLLIDDRVKDLQDDVILGLTPKGQEVAIILQPLLNSIDLSFKQKGTDIPNWDMNKEPQYFNQSVWNFIKDKKEKEIIQSAFLCMPAVSLMLNYLYRIERKKKIFKSEIYESFFKAPFIKKFCDQNGIDTAADEGAKRRCPFLFNILEAIGIITQTTREIEINCFVISNQTMMLENKESDFYERINKLYDFLCKNTDVSFSKIEISLLKEAFGKEFMTESYYLNDFVKLITDRTLYVFCLKNNFECYEK